MRRIFHFTKWIPTSSKLLYPFWLAAQLDIIQEEAVFDQLPAAFDGLVVAYASDIHYGPFFDAQRSEYLAQQLNAMQADIIMLGGDYGEKTASSIELFKVLPDLKARLGVFASMGNHDLMGSKSQIRQLKEQISMRGIKLLENSAHIIKANGSSLCLCATDDYLKGSPDFSPLLKAVDESDFTIYSPHSPDVLPQAYEQESFRFDLALCGHTHGGQLVLFGRSLHSSSAYGETYARGWIQVKGGRLMVSHGVGTSLIPVRIGVRPQIHRIVLRKSA